MPAGLVVMAQSGLELAAMVQAAGARRAGSIPTCHRQTGCYMQKEDWDGLFPSCGPPETSVVPLRWHRLRRTGWLGNPLENLERPSLSVKLRLAAPVTTHPTLLLYNSHPVPCLFLQPGLFMTTVEFGTWPLVVRTFPLVSFVCVTGCPAPAGSGVTPGLSKTTVISFFEPLTVVCTSAMMTLLKKHF